MEFRKEELVKSPLNYTGGKYRLLPQILPLFPNNIDTFVDIFAGGCNVGANVKANKIIFNDVVHYIINTYEQMIKEKSCELVIEKIHKVISNYKLSKENLEGFLNLRKDYNDKIVDGWEYFLVLVFFSFNHQFRFNSKMEYNSSFGKAVSSYKPVTEERVKLFYNKFKRLNYEFTTMDFREFPFSKLNRNDFVYLDPPYLITTGNYNDGKRGFNGWNKKDDIDLMRICDSLNFKGIRFALSNVLENKGKSNDVLKEWAKKYNINYLNNTYNNSNYNANDKSKDSTIEVLITNY